MVFEQLIKINFNNIFGFYFFAIMKTIKNQSLSEH